MQDEEQHLKLQLQQERGHTVQEGNAKQERDRENVELDEQELEAEQADDMRSREEEEAAKEKADEEHLVNVYYQQYQQQEKHSSGIHVAANTMVVSSRSNHGSPPDIPLKPTKSAVATKSSAALPTGGMHVRHSVTSAVRSASSATALESHRSQPDDATEAKAKVNPPSSATQAKMKKMRTEISVLKSGLAKQGIKRLKTSKVIVHHDVQPLKEHGEVSVTPFTKPHHTEAHDSSVKSVEPVVMEGATTTKVAEPASSKI